MVDEIGGPTDGTPDHIWDLAKACKEYVIRAVGTPLDDTPETLPLLDHYLGQLRKEKPSPLIELVISAAGAYFGELVRQRFHCRWHAPPGEPFRWRLEFVSIFLHFNPAAVAFEAIIRRDSGLGASYETREVDEQRLQEVLKNLPPVREQDFYTLGLRLEVLEKVVSELTLLAQSRGDPDLYQAADYKAAIDAS